MEDYKFFRILNETDSLPPTVTHLKKLNCFWTADIAHLRLRILLTITILDQTLRSLEGLVFVIALLHNMFFNVYQI